MYYLVYGLLWLVSLLPLPILYLFSELFYFIVYHLVKYRRPVVMNNLALAFPSLTEKERTRIAKQFYRNFIDSLIETIKLISAGPRFIERRGEGDYQLINDLAAKGYSINIMAGHQFNWEFANLLYSSHLKITFVGIYMPISNKILDRIFFRMRGRNGTVLVSAQEFRNQMHQVFSKQYSIGLAADQNPGNPSNAYWMNFMGHPAPFLKGPAKGAIRNKAAVVFVAMQKAGRGRYKFKTTLIAEDTENMEAAELTRLYKVILEKTIREDPSNYLWSHRRWKWEWKPEYGEILKD